MEVHVKAWASETEKGRKPWQGVVRTRLLLWAARAQFDQECVSESPFYQRQVRPGIYPPTSMIHGLRILPGELLP